MKQQWTMRFSEIAIPAPGWVIEADDAASTPVTVVVGRGSKRADMARLIAAAPALLSALKSCRPYVAEWNGLAHEVEDAIRLAEGDRYVSFADEIRNGLAPEARA